MMKFRRRRFICIAGSLALFPALSRLANAQSAEGEAVLNAREAALVSRDGQAILQLFAENALVVSSSGRLFIGREQIRNWVQDQIERAQREETGPRYQQGAKLSWPGWVYREDWQKMGVSPLDVIQDAIVQDGKIRFFNTTFTPESAARFDAARRKN
jgi:hypothetical protein